MLSLTRVALVSYQDDHILLLTLSQAGLFPDQVLHLGGDEVGNTCYDQSAGVRAWLTRHPGIGVDDLTKRVEELTRLH